MSIGVWVAMNESLEEKVKSSISQAEWVGVLISPSTNTLLNVELLETAYDKGVVGNPCAIEFYQDGELMCALGQITSIELRNPHIERHPIQRIISVRGEAQPLTRQQDTRRIEISISAVYSICGDNLQPATMGTVPPTGTRVYLLTQQIIDSLLEKYRDEIFYIGKMYNTDILLPMIFKHFGKGKGGLGEAYHIGIFGKTGSGKSYLAMMILTAYARHSDMSIIVIDPQGEFSRQIRNKNSPLRRALDKLKRKVEVYPIVKISLSNPETLKRLLIISRFLYKMGISAQENQEVAAEIIVDALRNPNRYAQSEQARADTHETRTLGEFGVEVDNESEESIDIHNLNNINITTAHTEEVFRFIMDVIRRNIEDIYRTEESQQRVLRTIRTRYNELYREWKRITMLFSTENKSNIENILRGLIKEKAIIFIDISEQTAEGIFWNERVQSLIINDIINSLKSIGNNVFKRGDYLNTLVVIDEAHRFASREKQEEAELEELRMNIVDAVRTTRKYGLGWMFISQTIASLHPELINQMRVYFFGYGLSWGAELRALKEIVGGGGGDTHLQLYKSFKDPQSSAILGEREHPFMVFGPVSPLSVSGAPIFMNALNYETEFLNLNKLE